MAQYRFLQDAWINNQYFLAGTIAATADVGGPLPTGWRPNGNVDPLDTPAVNAFYAQGPQPLGLVRQQWDGLPVGPPLTFWKATTLAAGPPSWTLTGLGAGLPPISN